MKKELFISLLAVIFASCQSDMGKVKTMFNEFVEAQANDDTEKLLAIYPSMEGLGVCNIDATDAKFIFNEMDSTYQIVLPSDITFDVEKQTDGSFIITDSHGFVSWNNVWMSVFERAGALESGMSDMKINQIFDDGDFLNYLVAQNPKAMQGNLVVVACIADRIYDTDYNLNIDLRNESQYDFSRKNYSLEIAVLDADGNVLKTESESGKDIRSGEIENFYVYYSGDYCRRIASHNVKIILPGYSNIDLLNTFAQFTGEEYNNYLSTK